MANLEMAKKITFEDGYMKTIWPSELPWQCLSLSYFQSWRVSEWQKHFHIEWQKVFAFANGYVLTFSALP